MLHDRIHGPLEDGGGGLCYAVPQTTTIVWRRLRTRRSTISCCFLFANMIKLFTSIASQRASLILLYTRLIYFIFVLRVVGGKSSEHRVVFFWNMCMRRIGMLVAMCCGESLRVPRFPGHVEKCVYDFRWSQIGTKSFSMNPYGILEAPEILTIFKSSSTIRKLKQKMSVIVCLPWVLNYSLWRR